MAPLLYCMAQAPCNPGHSALVMTSDSPGNYEGLATPLLSVIVDTPVLVRPGQLAI